MSTAHQAVVGRKAAARLVAREARDSEKPARRLRASVIGSDQRNLVLLLTYGKTTYFHNSFMLSHQDVYILSIRKQQITYTIGTEYHWGGLPSFMACKVAHDGGGTTIHLVGQLDDQDFNRIEDGFERALDRHDRAVVFECSGLERVNSSVRALIGVLQLQARRAGTVIELRNLGPGLAPLMGELKETTVTEDQGSLRVW